MDNQTSPSISLPEKRVHRIIFTLIAVSLFLTGHFAVGADGPPHLNITLPGGMPGWPVITGFEQGTNNLTITWDGPPGYYRIMESKTPQGKSWTQVGGPTLTRKATITTLS
ncbi:MAG: hypothetical protein H7Y43_06865, partial [Akkermansiaceae bacterium]|nr:hypothetical protein [Verrucomicrobiales bacterium]